MKKMGAPYGERHGKAKIPDSTVKQIRDRYFDNAELPSALSAEYGISINTVWDWLKFKTRVHHNE